PAATPTPPSPPKNSAGAPNSASKPCAPTPGAGSPTTPKATAKPPPGSTPSHPGRVLLRVRGRVRFCCRSTAHGANGVGTHSHPGRLLLRSGVGFGFVVGAPPTVRTG